MFPKRQRLARAAFPGGKAAGRRVHTPHFSLLAPASGRGYAVVVPKQVARLSVTRHRLKRQAAAALRTVALPPSLVVYARTGAPALDYAQIRAELEAGIGRIA